MMGMSVPSVSMVARPGKRTLLARPKLRSLYMRTAVTMSERS
jgi:hypothetical protein